MRHEHAFDEIVVLGGGCGPAAPAAPLRAVVGERLRLDVAAVREGDHHVLRRDQVFEGNILGDGDDLAAAAIAELFLDVLQLAFDDCGDAHRLVEDVEQVGDGYHDLAVLVADLVLFQAGEALQPKLENGLRLLLGEPIALGLEAELRAQPLRPVLLMPTRNTREHLLHKIGIPASCEQLALRIRRRGRFLDQFDHVVHVGKSDRQAFQDVAALARLLQLEHGAARHHLAPV